MTLCVLGGEREEGRGGEGGGERRGEGEKREGEKRGGERREKEGETVTALVTYSQDTLTRHTTG